MKLRSVTLIFLVYFSIAGYGQNDSISNSSEKMFLGCVFEEQPSFPGGIKSLKKFINKNLKYPKRSGCVEGTAFVSFIVNEDGALSDFAIMKSVCEECDQNAIDVLKKMPKWIPGKQNGKALKVRCVYPVKFTL